MNLVLLGPPGTGKGTIAQFLKESLGLRHFSTGEALRSEIKEGTKLGKEIAPVVNRGEYVSDRIVAKVVEAMLDSDSARKGFVFDGYPRNISQAKTLAKLLEKRNIKLDHVLYLDTKDSIIVERLAARRQCVNCKIIYGQSLPPKKEGVCDSCGGSLYMRDDDRPEVVKKRLEVYKKLTAPVIGYYEEKGLLRKVDANRPLAQIVQEIGALAKEPS